MSAKRGPEKLADWFGWQGLGVGHSYTFVGLELCLGGRLVQAHT